MKRVPSQCSLDSDEIEQEVPLRHQRKVSTEDGPERQQLLCQLSTSGLVVARRQSLTAPTSPAGTRKKNHPRQHNYINHLHHLIHWKDIWSGETHKGHESLHRSESMVSLEGFKTLSDLVNKDNPDDLKVYLSNKKSVNVDDTDGNGTTALMVACEKGKAAAVYVLLGSQADPAAADADGWTPLAYAAKGGHLTIVKELISVGVPIDPMDCEGWTPLLWASYKGFADVVSLLLENKADVHIQGHYNINSLVWAAGRGHSEVVQLLLAGGARPNSCDKYATTALTWAARAGDLTSCTELLKAGANPNIAGMYSWTPLLQATQGNHVEIVDLLLDYRPNLNVFNKDGLTALAVACKEGFYDVAQSLIRHGAYINGQDNSKDTPLIYAVKGGHKNIVEALVKKHVDINLAGKDKKTPVYAAVEKGQIAVLKILLASNPDLEHYTANGETALLRAVKLRNVEMVQLLVDRRARVSVTDNKGDTPLHIAMRARSKNIVEILLRNPKNSKLLYKPNNVDETPYTIDMSHHKTILAQIFGARKLNVTEENENMLGYELYSATLADMLSKPNLSVPMTVGLYARWGSGKSFLLNKLKEEMMNFAMEWRETRWTWSWGIWWGLWHLTLAMGAFAAMAGVPPLLALVVTVALFVLTIVVFCLIHLITKKYQLKWLKRTVEALGSYFNSLLLVLQVSFCHPPGPLDPRALASTHIRFHFTEGMKNQSGQAGQDMLINMMSSLAEALENQYGRMSSRLARTFRPQPVSETAGWRWRKVCCFPNILFFEVTYVSFFLGLCVLMDLYVHQTWSTNYVERGMLIAVGVLMTTAALANLYTCLRVITAMMHSWRYCLNAAAKHDSSFTALRRPVEELTAVVACLDAFTGQQTRLVVVVDALDSCEQDKVLNLLNGVHALCSDPKSPFILLLAIDPHIISKAVEVNSRRAFAESNIGGWDYLRNMVQLPFYLQNPALARVKVARQTAAKKQLGTSDEAVLMQRSASTRRLSTASELISSNEARKESARRVPHSLSHASSVASGMHRMAQGPADITRVLPNDDYFSDVTPRSMRRLLNVLYITGRLLKAFQVDFDWYQLSSWVNLTEQWPFRVSWIIYYYEVNDHNFDDKHSLKSILDIIKPKISSTRYNTNISSYMDLDRDARKLEVFLNYHRTTLTVAELKTFLPFTINLDPHIKKFLKEELADVASSEELTEIQPLSSASVPRARLHIRPPSQRHSKRLPMDWSNAEEDSVSYFHRAQGPHPQAINPFTMLNTAFPRLAAEQDIPNLRLSKLDVERVCLVVQLALGDAEAAASLQAHRITGLVLTHCHLDELKPVLNLPFGDWELFKMLITNLRNLESSLPSVASIVSVSEDRSSDIRIRLESKTSRVAQVERQVTLEEQMIFGALQTLNEEDTADPDTEGEKGDKSLSSLNIGEDLDELEDTTETLFDPESKETFMSKVVLETVDTYTSKNAYETSEEVSASKDASASEGAPEFGSTSAAKNTPASGSTSSPDTVINITHDESIHDQPNEDEPDDSKKQDEKNNESKK